MSIDLRRPDRLINYMCESEMPRPKGLLIDSPNIEDLAFKDKEIGRQINTATRFLDDVATEMERVVDSGLDPIVTRENISQLDIRNDLIAFFHAFMDMMAQQWRTRYPQLTHHFDGLVNRIKGNVAGGMSIPFELTNLAQNVHRLDYRREADDLFLEEIISTPDFARLVKAFAAGNSFVLERFFTIISESGPKDGHGILTYDPEYFTFVYNEGRRIITFKSEAICLEIHNRLMASLPPISEEGTDHRRIRYGCPMRYLKTAGGVNGIDFTLDLILAAIKKHWLPRFKREGSESSGDVVYL